MERNQPGALGGTSEKMKMEPALTCTKKSQQHWHVGATMHCSKLQSKMTTKEQLEKTSGNKEIWTAGLEKIAKAVQVGAGWKKWSVVYAPLTVKRHKSSQAYKSV